MYKLCDAMNKKQSQIMSTESQLFKVSYDFIIKIFN